MSSAALAVRPRLLLSLALLAAPAARATSVLPPDFPALVAEAEAIHRVTPLARETRRVAAPGGGTVLWTRVTFAVTATLKGPARERLTLDFLGGELGDEVMTVTGVPRFEPGSEDYVFVAGDGRVFCPLVGLGHGRYRVLRDPATGRAYVAREDHRPLGDPAEVGQPLADTAGAARPLLAAREAGERARALTPAAFEAAVAREAARGTTRVHAP